MMEKKVELVKSELINGLMQGRKMTYNYYLGLWCAPARYFTPIWLLQPIVLIASILVGIIFSWKLALAIAAASILLTIATRAPLSRRSSHYFSFATYKELVSYEDLRKLSRATKQARETGQKHLIAKALDETRIIERTAEKL